MARVRPVIIAHRGASGYLPEHTLAAKALAVGMGANYVEQDVVATRDGELIVFHDLTLDLTTDVSERFPGRCRPDGHFYCADFDLRELRTLSIGERRTPAGTAQYPGRFPLDGGHFRINTFEEELRFLGGLSRSSGRRIGIYPEIKEPAWHRHVGIDLGARVLEALGRFGYRDSNDAVFVQCFDASELQRLRADGCRLRLVQLIDGDVPVPERSALAAMAGYADAIGPSLRLLRTAAGEGTDSTLVRDAHEAGLAVHPYTLRKDDLPAGTDTFDKLLEMVFLRQGADGAFTDFPDLVAEFIARRFS